MFFAIAYLAWFGINPIETPPALILPALALPVFLVVYGSRKRSRLAYIAFVMLLILNIGGCRMWPERLRHYKKEKSEQPAEELSPAAARQTKP